MKTALRTLLAVVAGLALAFVLVIAVELFSAVVHPVPRDLPAPWTKCASMSPVIPTGFSGLSSWPGAQQHSSAHGSPHELEIDWRFGWRYIRDGTVRTISRFRGSAIHAVVLMTVAASAGAQEVVRKAGETVVLRDSRPDSAMSGTNFLCMRSLALGRQSTSTAARRRAGDKAANPPNPASNLRGRILFHRYTNYDAWDGHLYLYEFATKRLSRG